MQPTTHPSSLVRPISHGTTQAILTPQPQTHQTTATHGIHPSSLSLPQPSFRKKQPQMMFLLQSSHLQIIDRVSNYFRLIIIIIWKVLTLLSRYPANFKQIRINMVYCMSLG